MNLEALKKEVYEANMELVEKKLVISTWGNVSGFDEERQLMVIKPSGVPYGELRPEQMVPVDMNGNVVDSTYVPSTDTDTHIELYKAFHDKGIHGIVHTHSQYATMWAQMGKNIPCYGTTHCDYFFGDIPCTRLMTTEEIEEAYEKNTGKVILEEFANRSCIEMQAVLVHSHAPFTWGKTPHAAVMHAQVLEYISKMAIFDYIATSGQCDLIRDNIKMKHYNRKFGPNAYYGQHKKEEQA
mgnify:FL=1